eukprot:Phypoly_transcript_17557.p1 GENE.Phypoly_transcript_17557~~Phypoly_transcript_17557.p1  ORF type:complete len:179 (+),score=26.63 Phypoly_transcript_17557:184-720(+)
MSYIRRLFSSSAKPLAMGVQKASFGAGCFWGTEKFFRKEFNLIDAKVGYQGGDAKNPTYKQVCTGNTGHAEVLVVEYDDTKVNYADLVRFFYRMHDPTTLNRQGNDTGTQYRSVIFFYTPEQEAIAKKVTQEIIDEKRYPDPIVTQIAPAGEFYTAEDYHQKYLEANPGGYCNHRIRW